MMNPLLTMAVLVVVFTQLFRRFNVEHYPIYLLSGLLLWRLFARGTSVVMLIVLGTPNGDIEGANGDAPRFDRYR